MVAAEDGGPAPQPSTFPFGQPVVWRPDAADVAASNLAAFLARHTLPDYPSLLTRAVAEPEWFWRAVLEELDIRFDRPYSRVLDTSDGIEFPRWCVDGMLNITRSCLDKWLSTPVAEQDALRWEGEEGAARRLTYRELTAEVDRCANALRALGLAPGDVVALYMPMIPELAVAFLAIVRMGAILLPLFSGYGPGAIAARLADAGARAVITADGTRRRGKPVALKAVLDEALATSPEPLAVEHVLVVRHADLDTGWVEGRDHWWHEYVPQQPATPSPAATAAEDVLMLIYTSGTTGRPKGAVHTHCGFPVKAAQDLRHCFDLKQGEVLYWMTDMGWMMGPWEVFGALLNGATMLFYDGGPDTPGPDRLWALVERHGVTHLGVSPTLIRTLKAHGAEPVRTHTLNSLRLVGSTGSPWDPEAWLWLFESVLERRKPIFNYSGGTEISGGILCGSFFAPLKPCAFGGPVPGMAADVVDAEGRPLRGAVGELVLRAPWIGMTRGFWRDRERYLESYWRRLPGVWLHGDFAAIDEDGLWYILGRSDDTIKVAGKRLGPSEVEVIVAAHPAVLECAAIGVPHPVKDNEVVVFCVLNRDAAALEGPALELLRAELMARVVAELGKPLRPRAILFAAQLPRTRNAKVMRRVVRAAWLGEEPGDLSSLEDPAAVAAVRAAR